MKNPEFLKKFKGLGSAPEVKSPKTRRQEKTTGEKIPEPGQPEENIQKYLDRLEKI